MEGVLSFTLQMTSSPLIPGNARSMTATTGFLETSSIRAVSPSEKDPAQWNRGFARSHDSTFARKKSSLSTTMTVIGLAEWFVIFGFAPASAT
jgi:hypothetical protein